MKQILAFTLTYFCACFGFFIATISVASATTLNLPNSNSDVAFSIQSSFPDTLTVGPFLTVNSNNCPSAYCVNSFWNVSLTVDFFSAPNSLLASDTAIVSENCTPSGCTVPKLASFAIPIGSIEFEIFNDVTVGGGWTYSAGAEFVNAGSQIAETPIPMTIYLFAAGLFGLSLLSWRHKTVVSRLF